MGLGDNTYGQLGDGTNINKNTPTKINCSNLGINDLKLENASFIISPNPVKEILNIQNIAELLIDKIIITDLSGKIILEKKENVKSVNIQHLQEGIYLLQIFTEGRNYSQKFIKQ